MKPNVYLCRFNKQRLVPVNKGFAQLSEDVINSYPQKRWITLGIS